jgi:hypothetical protein
LINELELVIFDLSFTQPEYLFQVCDNSFGEPPFFDHQLDLLHTVSVAHKSREIVLDDDCGLWRGSGFSRVSNQAH